MNFSKSHEKLSLKDYNEILTMKNSNPILISFDLITIYMILWIINKNFFSNWKNYLFSYIIVSILYYFISFIIIGLFYTIQIKPQIKIKNINLPNSEIIIDGALSLSNKDSRILKSFSRFIHPYRKLVEVYNFLLKNKTEDIIHTSLQLGDKIVKINFNSFEQFKDIMVNESYYLYIKAQNRLRHFKNNIIVTFFLIIFLIVIILRKEITLFDQTFLIIGTCILGIYELILITNYTLENKLYKIDL